MVVIMIIILFLFFCLISLHAIAGATTRVSVITKVLLYQVKCISYFVRCNFAVYPFVYPFVEVENAFCVTSVENATVE